MSDHAQVRIAGIDRFAIERSSWSDRHLFAFAVRSGDRTLVDFAVPDFALVDRMSRRGPRFRLAKEVGPAAHIGLAICAMACERDRLLFDSPIDRAVATAVFSARIERDAPLSCDGKAWEAGLDALSHMLGGLVATGRSETVFAFSRVYSWPARPDTHSLVQHRTGPAGQILSRYRVEIELRPEPTRPGAQQPKRIGSDSGMI